MASAPGENPQPVDSNLLMQAVGLVETDPGPDSLAAQIERFHQFAVRLRELDLSGVEPVTVYSARGSQRL